MIEVMNLSKRYGDTLAVDALTFSIQSGKVTGFLGPNGAGKSTTMRAIVGLDHPSMVTVPVEGWSSPTIARHRGRLAGAVRSQESGHLAGLDAKRQGVHGERVAVPVSYTHLTLPTKRIV